MRAGALPFGDGPMPDRFGFLRLLSVLGAASFQGGLLTSGVSGMTASGERWWPVSPCARVAPCAWRSFVSGCAFDGRGVRHDGAGRVVVVVACWAVCRGCFGRVVATGLPVCQGSCGRVGGGRLYCQASRHRSGLNAQLTTPQRTTPQRTTK